MSPRNERGWRGWDGRRRWSEHEACHQGTPSRGPKLLQSLKPLSLAARLSYPTPRWSPRRLRRALAGVPEGAPRVRKILRGLARDAGQVPRPHRVPHDTSSCVAPVARQETEFLEPARGAEVSERFEDSPRVPPCLI